MPPGIVPDGAPLDVADSPGDRTDWNGEMYEVEAIVNERTRAFVKNGKTKTHSKYQIKMKGWASVCNRWVSQADFIASFRPFAFDDASHAFSNEKTQEEGNLVQNYRARKRAWREEDEKAKLAPLQPLSTAPSSASPTIPPLLSVASNESKASVLDPAPQPEPTGNLAKQQGLISVKESHPRITTTQHEFTTANSTKKEMVLKHEAYWIS
ncbi:hypothetical protein HDU98_009957 [Podochytrium sp. JEL0797]|nr:hypothetical protein HDU98_009957 [Podochytrium sp. JEL0797]